MSEFKLRDYRAGDEALVVDMFNRIFKAPYSEDLWRWKYGDGPYARPELSVIAEGPGGEIVGHGAVFCQPLNLIGRKKTCGQVTDLMIDPAQQKSGVGSAIYSRCAGNMAKAGFPVCLAFPNQHSAVGLHWHASHVAIMEKYVLVRGGDSQDKLRDLVEAEPEDERLDLQWVPNFLLDARADDLFASMAPLESLSIHKDSTYLAWRYGAHPTRDYRMCALIYGDMLMGLAVVFQDKRTLRVLELMVRNKRPLLAQRLLHYLVEDADETIDDVRFTGRDPWFFEAALEPFERRPAFSHHVFARATDRDQAFLYENPLNWTCGLGDCDSV
jgi:predicted N-acetyltransferase YhbS